MPDSILKSDRLPPGVWKIVSVALLGPFLSQLDATIVNVSLSSLEVELHTSLSVIQWVTSGYLLALALMLPLNAWLVERIGAKSLYLICFSGFTLFSALCAFSWSASALIGFRVLQGACGGLMAPMAQLMLARAAGKHLVRVVSYAAAPILIGPILGPVVAGTILQHATWRWLFLINLPIGVLAIIVASLFLPSEKGQAETGRDLDVIGFVLLSPALVLILYASDHLSEQGSVTLILISMILLALFIYRAIKDGSRALVDVQLFRSGIFSASALTQFTINGLSFAGQMMIPAFLIRGADQSPGASGWLMAPLGVGMMVTYPSLEKLIQSFGIRGTAVRGACLALLGTLPFLYLSSCAFSSSVLIVSLLIRGAGMSAVGVPSISAAYGSVRRDELPMATTSLSIVQRLGGPMLTTIFATFLGWRLAADHSHSAVESAFTMSFALLCALHAFLVFAAMRLPRGVHTESGLNVQDVQPITE